MTLFYILLPFIILMLVGVIFLIPYHVNHKNLSPKRFFIIYWVIIILVEAIYILSLDQVQFIPPSIFMSYIYGTIFFLIYMIQCIFYNISKKEKLAFIGYAILLNYFISPILLMFIKW